MELGQTMISASDVKDIPVVAGPDLKTNFLGELQ